MSDTTPSGQPTEWYFERNRNQQGPVTSEFLLSAHASGTVPDSALVWNESMPGWEPLAKHLDSIQAEVSATAASLLTASVPGRLQASLAADTQTPESLLPMEICAYSGNVFPREDMLQYGNQWIAPEHKEAFVQSLMEGHELDPALTGQHVYAGFWIRFGAKFIDGIVGWVLGMIVQVPVAMIYAEVNRRQPRTKNSRFSSSHRAISMIIGFLYTVLMTWHYQATLGKMARVASKSSQSMLTVSRSPSQ